MAVMIIDRIRLFKFSLPFSTPVKIKDKLLNTREGYLINITDDQGKKVAVILSIKDYEKLMKELEELEDIKLFDEAKKDDDGSRMLLSEYVKKRKLKNG